MCAWRNSNGILNIRSTRSPQCPPCRRLELPHSSVSDADGTDAETQTISFTIYMGTRSHRRHRLAIVYHRIRRCFPRRSNTATALTLLQGSVRPADVAVGGGRRHCLPFNLCFRPHCGIRLCVCILHIYDVYVIEVCSFVVSRTLHVSAMQCSQIMTNRSAGGGHSQCLFFNRRGRGNSPLA